MKLKLVSTLSLVLFFFAFVLFSACKKDDATPNNNGENDVVSAAVTDESQVTTEMDGIALDAATAIEYEPTFSGNYGVLDQIICDATVTYSTSTDPMTVTITYNGSNCGAGRSRTGSIVQSIASPPALSPNVATAEKVSVECLTDPPVTRKLQDCFTTTGVTVEVLKEPPKRFVPHSAIPDSSPSVCIPVIVSTAPLL